MEVITQNASLNATAVALGFFDGLHLGHIEVIKRALGHAHKNKAKSLVFTFNNATMLPKFNTRENIISYEMKLELLEKIGVDYVFAPDFATEKDLTAEEFVVQVLKSTLNARFVACGYDFHFAKGGSADSADLKQICEKHGIEVCVVPAVSVDGKIVSSTDIRELIRSGNVKKANELLGYELTYILKVVHGKRIGRTLGFPTINQFIPQGNIVPRFGVYKSWTQVGAVNYPSVTNIGVKPTIEADEGEIRLPNMETHIIGYEGDLYDLSARVVLREYLRGEQKFANLDELKAQLELDKRKALEF